MKKSLAALGLLVVGIPQALAGATNTVVFLTPSIPTLDEVGLLGLTIIVAIAGGIAARRRKRK